ncbi:unnamed protein product [Meloidogyne enterolobii]|uniref:Uncharacterized protein n=1 Tax=Meloidogyne enterolobii TaxID=390850 RepID=A0ACB0YGR8_MELEN
MDSLTEKIIQREINQKNQQLEEEQRQFIKLFGDFFSLKRDPPFCSRETTQKRLNYFYKELIICMKIFAFV